jgi:hypothetical protein
MHAHGHTPSSAAGGLKWYLNAVKSSRDALQHPAVVHLSICTAVVEPCLHHPPSGGLRQPSLSSWGTAAALALPQHSFVCVKATLTDVVLPQCGPEHTHTHNTHLHPQPYPGSRLASKTPLLLTTAAAAAADC